MDAIYDGDDWVDHYTWRLVGSDDNGDVVFDGLCPKHLHPFVSSLIESSARVAPYSSPSLHDTDVLKTIRESIDEGTMSGPLFSRLVGLDEIGSKRLLAGEKVELTYRSMISILRLADVLRKLMRLPWPCGSLSHRWVGAEYFSDDLLGLGVVLDGICRIIEILDEIFQSGTFLNGERDSGPPCIL